jgi:LAS superfamily LD-carboxypeptidase LdcB
MLRVFVSAAKGACFGSRVSAWILDNACQYWWFLSYTDSTTYFRVRVMR